MKEIPKELILTEKEKRPEVPHPSEPIFKAYLEGNSRIPQTMRGIPFFVLAAAFEEPNLNWDELFESKLSPEQLAELKEAAEKMHAKRGVSQDLNEMGLQTIWTVARDLASRQLDDAIEQEVVFIRSGDFDKYMKDGDNAALVEKIKNTVLAIRDALRSSEANTLFEHWRKEISHPENKGYVERLWQKGAYHKKVLNLVNAHISEHKSSASPELADYLLR